MPAAAASEVGGLRTSAVPPPPLSSSRQIAHPLLLPHPVTSLIRVQWKKAGKASNKKVPPPEPVCFGRMGSKDPGTREISMKCLVPHFTPTNTYNCDHECAATSTSFLTFLTNFFLIAHFQRHTA